MTRHPFRSELCEDGSSFPRIAACLSDADNRLYPIVIPLTIHTATRADQRPLPSHHRELRSRTGMRQTHLIISACSFAAHGCTGARDSYATGKSLQTQKGSSSTLVRRACTLFHDQGEIPQDMKQNCGGQVGAKDIWCKSSSVSE